MATAPAPSRNGSISFACDHCCAGSGALHTSATSCRASPSNSVAGIGGGDSTWNARAPPTPPRRGTRTPPGQREHASKSRTLRMTRSFTPRLYHPPDRPGHASHRPQPARVARRHALRMARLRATPPRTPSSSRQRHHRPHAHQPGAPLTPRPTPTSTKPARIRARLGQRTRPTQLTDRGRTAVADRQRPPEAGASARSGSPSASIKR